MATKAHATDSGHSSFFSAIGRAKAAFADRAAHNRLAMEVAKERRALAKMSQRMLSDMGITADDARAESRRSFGDLRGVSRPARE